MGLFLLACARPLSIMPQLRETFKLLGQLHPWSCSDRYIPAEHVLSNAIINGSEFLEMDGKLPRWPLLAPSVIDRES